MTDARAKVIILHETMLQSIGRDIGTFFIIIAVIGTGWLLGSGAMQWLGFLMLVLLGFARVSSRSHMTPQEATNWLYKEYGVRPE